MALYDAVAEFKREGKVLVAGEAALDGANPTVIETGLKEILSVSLNLKLATTPGLTAALLTYSTSGGTLSVYAWQPTSASNPTLVAADDTYTFSYTVFGLRR